MKTPLHIGFALYGFDAEKVPPSATYRWALNWFESYSCKPDIADADIHGKTNGNYKSFRTVNRKLQDSEYEGFSKFTLLDVPENLSGLKHGQSLGEDMTVIYSSNPNNKFFVFHLKDEIATRHRTTVLVAAKEASEMLEPKYGFIFYRPFHNGPSLYGMGMRHNGNYLVDDDNMEYWTTLYDHEAFTLLRSVYPWNLLTNMQLDIKVGRQRLENWIRAFDDRGTLSKFTETITLWTVPDERILPVRNLLWEAGVILDRKRHFEEVMDKYHVDEDVVAEHYRTGIPINKNPR